MPAAAATRSTAQEVGMERAMPLSPPAAAKEGMARACAAMRARESEDVAKKSARPGSCCGLRRRPARRPALTLSSVRPQPQEDHELEAARGGLYGLLVGSSNAKPLARVILQLRLLLHVRGAPGQAPTGRCALVRLAGLLILAGAGGRVDGWWSAAGAVGCAGSTQRHAARCAAVAQLGAPLFRS
jgi:hypothetical protein